MKINNNHKRDMEVGSGTAAAGTPESDLRRKSRTAAFWYLVQAVTGPFVLIYIPSRFIVAGDAAATIANITASPTLFRLGIAVSFITVTSFLFTGIALYELFKPVDKGQARAMVALVATCTPVSFLNILFQIAPLLLTSGAGYLKAFAPAELQSLAMAFLDLHKQGNLIAQIFWGLWLLPLGILIYKSGFFPKILGLLEMAACAGYLADSLVAILFPAVRGKVNPITMILAFGELPFIFWLIIRGARMKSPKKAAPAGA